MDKFNKDGFAKELEHLCNTYGIKIEGSVDFGLVFQQVDYKIEVLTGEPVECPFDEEGGLECWFECNCVEDSLLG